MGRLTVTEEIVVGASPGAVWTVLTDPALHPELDPRCRLRSTAGTPGTVGSSYVLMVTPARGRPTALEYRLSEVVSERFLNFQVHRPDGVWQTEQRAELIAEGDGVRLRWSIGIDARWVNRPLYRRACARELPTWLAAVDRVSRGR